MLNLSPLVTLIICHVLVTLAVTLGFPSGLSLHLFLPLRLLQATLVILWAVLGSTRPLVRLPAAAAMLLGLWAAGLVITARRIAASGNFAFSGGWWLGPSITTALLILVPAAVAAVGFGILRLERGRLRRLDSTTLELAFDPPEVSLREKVLWLAAAVLFGALLYGAPYTVVFAGPPGRSHTVAAVHLLQPAVSVLLVWALLRPGSIAASGVAALAAAVLAVGLAVWIDRPPSPVGPALYIGLQFLLLAAHLAGFRAYGLRLVRDFDYDDLTGTRPPSRLRGSAS